MYSLIKGGICVTRIQDRKKAADLGPLLRFVRALYDDCFDALLLEDNRLDVLQA